MRVPSASQTALDSLVQLVPVKPTNRLVGSPSAPNRSSSKLREHKLRSVARAGCSGRRVPPLASG